MHVPVKPGAVESAPSAETVVPSGVVATQPSLSQSRRWLHWFSSHVQASVLAYCPTVQAEQDTALCTETEPLGQVSQEEDGVPAWYVPGEQSAQASDPEAANWPFWQSLQEAWPVVSWYLPTAQAVQLVDPADVCGAKRPATHAEQLVLPASELNLPSAHAKHTVSTVLPVWSGSAY